jgi:alpha-D-ribose 1-methylphosphonate 5-triphosphate synthase subunit PhnL
MGALFDPRQLTRLGPGHYRYNVTRVQVFQLSIRPVVELDVTTDEGHVEIRSLACELEGLGLVDDFNLDLLARLAAGSEGLEGEAALGVTVSRPALLKLIPTSVLEATGRSVLSGILLTIKNRVGTQLVGDFHSWCETH